MTNLKINFQRKFNEKKTFFCIEEVPQKKIPISYNIFFCDTSSTSASEEEAPATEEDTLAHMGKGLSINEDTHFWGFIYPPPKKRKN